jgi:hypothetical protein
MIVYADAAYRLEAFGLDDDVSPLVIYAHCQRCDQILSQRRYRRQDRSRAPDGLTALVQAHAAEDTAAALAHVCVAP